MNIRRKLGVNVDHNVSSSQTHMKFTSVINRKTLSVF